jgi:hypothetical protein
MSQYWDRQTEGWRQGMGNISQAMIQLPRLRAMQAYRQQLLAIQAAREQAYAEEAANRNQLIQAQAGEAGAHSGLFTSQAGEANARTAELVKKGSLIETVQTTAPAAMRAMAAGKTDDPTVDEFTGAVSALTGENKGDLMESFRKGMATVLASGGNVKKAGEVANPVSVLNNREDNAQKAAKPGAAGFNTTTTTETFPEVAGSLSTPEVKHWFTANEPAIPAKTGAPARKVVTSKRTPIASGDLAGALLGNGAQGTDMESDTEATDETGQPETPAAVPAAAPATPKMIRVLHPDGKTSGMIPAENLQAALKAGYTLIGK